jgi:hypothetical protein
LPGRACRKRQLRRRREVEQLLELGHEVHLAAALQRVDALLGGDHRVAVEVGGALLELGEVLDRLQRALRAEQALDVDAAQRRRVDAMAELLRADVADQRWVAALVWPLAWQSKQATPRLGLLAAAVLGLVELLLRERRHQQAQPSSCLG